MRIADLSDHAETVGVPPVAGEMPGVHTRLPGR